MTFYQKITLVIRLIFRGIKNPIRTLRLLNYQNFKILRTALNYEGTSEIINNFSTLVGKSSVTSTNNFNKKDFLASFFEKIDRKKPTVILVSHEASLTGAPLIVLKIGKILSKSYNIQPIFLLCKGGEIEHIFCSIGDTLKIHSWANPDSNLPTINECKKNLKHLNLVGIFVNSVESRWVLPYLKPLNVTLITLVHEMAYYYEKNNWKIVNDYSDKIIFPAELVKELALKNTYFDKEKILVLGQGLLNENLLCMDKENARKYVLKELDISEKSFIVLGCGTACGRKGIDFFISAAISTIQQLNSKEIVFLWIGEILPHETYVYWGMKDIEISGYKEQIRFIGSREDTSKYFTGSDVFLMTSKGDPFPCVVHEAMASALPVICFDKGTGAAEAIGDIGLKAPYGDVVSLSKIVIDLFNDRQKGKNIGAELKKRVIEKYNYTNYVNTLRGFINFKGEANDLYGRNRIIFTFEDWWISGVNTFVEALVKELIKIGYDAYILFTTDRPLLYSSEFLPKIPYKYLNPETDDYRDIWSALKGHLEKDTPCIFVPNYDYVASAISPSLSSNVGILGILHSDDIEHYEHGYRLGLYWNKIICVSKTIEKKFLSYNPIFKNKSSVIYYGTRSDSKLEYPIKNSIFTIIYTGRLIQFQKRVLDFFTLVEKLGLLNINFLFKIIGSGPEEDELKRKLGPYIQSNQVEFLGRRTQEFIEQELRKAHVFILTSDFEGLPLSLLEAMCNYCVPVLTDIESGISEIIKDKKNGFIYEVGNIDKLVEIISYLIANPTVLEITAKEAFKSFFDYNLDSISMAGKYEHVIKEIFDATKSGIYTRPKALSFRSELGDILPAPMHQKI